MDKLASEQHLLLYVIEGAILVATGLVRSGQSAKLEKIAGNPILARWASQFILSASLRALARNDSSEKTFEQLVAEVSALADT